MVKEGSIGADAAKLAGLQIDLLQKLRQGKITLVQIERFICMSAEDRNKFFGVADDRFTLVSIVQIVVPDDYNHETCLADFRKEFGDEFYYFNKDITDEKFGNVTSKLKPGQKLELRIFQIEERISSEECLALLKSQNAILVGAQGLSLACKFAKDQLQEKGKAYLSFDKKESLWRDAGGDRRVPYVCRLLGGDVFFSLDVFERGWVSACRLLCFCDLSE